MLVGEKHFLYFVEQKQNKSSTQEAIMENNIFNLIQGFEYIETFDMEFSKKQYGMNYNNEKGVISNKEPVMCFRKVK